MNIEIIVPNGDLKRERWNFCIRVEYNYKFFITLDNYSFETKKSTRCKKWITETTWSRLYGRESNIPKPIVSQHLEDTLKGELCKRIQETKIS